MKGQFRGIVTHTGIDLNQSEFNKVLTKPSNRVLPQHFQLMSRLLRAKEAAVDGKPKIVRTRVSDLMITPAMISNVLAVHNGRGFKKVEITPNMVGSKLNEIIKKH